MNKNDVIHTLNCLSELRPVFHSEADFQHELAIKLREKGYACRLEIPHKIEINGADIKVELDILVIEKGSEKTAIELKYVKKSYSGIHGNEQFDLASSWGTNLSRFDFFADLHRVTALVDAGKATKGFTIFLTNQQNAWNIDITGTGNLGSQFSIHEGRFLARGDVLNWTGNFYEGNVGSKRLPPYSPIQINQNIKLNWYNYSNQGTCFRYLLIECKKIKQKESLPTTPPSKGQAPIEPNPFRRPRNTPFIKPKPKVTYLLNPDPKLNIS